MTERKYNIAVVGATGLVGSELLGALAYRRFPVEEIGLYASWNTAGEKMAFMDDEIKVEPISGDFYEDRDIVFFTAHQMVSRDLAEQAAEAGALVIDSSPAFRLDPDVPLVVPEVNPEALSNIREGKRIVASPSAAAVALALVLKPLGKDREIRRVIAAVACGSTAGGRQGFEEHQFQTASIFSQEAFKVERFTRRTAFNIFPRVGGFDDHGDTEAEQELMQELPRILGVDVPIAATAMQAPVFCGIALTVNIEFKGKMSVDEIREELSAAPGVTVVDDPQQEAYPDTLLAMEQDEILIGRIRPDPTNPKALQLWISADNLRKGSALNMVHISELILGSELDN
jgi:aspartate-semialdehyde dehydrogenase